MFIIGCTDNSTSPTTGHLEGRVTIDGEGADGVVIDVSSFQISGGGSAKAQDFSGSTQNGDYSIELTAGKYRADYTFYGYNDQILRTARYPIEIVSGKKTKIDVELKDPVPHSFLAQNGNAAVELSWESSYGASSYLVYRADSTAGDFQLLAYVDSSSGTINYTDQPPVVGTYNYYVTSTNASGVESDYEAIKEVDFTAAIRPPSGLEAVDMVEFVLLSWDSNNRAFYYRIYRSRNNTGNWMLLDSTSATQYSDIPPDTSIYYYHVTALSLYGTESSASTNVSVNFDGRFDPPSGLAIIDKGSSLDLSWQPYSNAAYYSIYRAIARTGNYSKIDTTSESSYSDEPPDTGTFYYYVTATGPNGLESEASDTVHSSYDGILDYPSGFAAFNRGLNVELNWNEVLWAGAYLIFRSDDGTIYVEIARVGGTVTSYDDVPLNSGLYYYRIATETITGVRGELCPAVSVNFTDNLLAPTNVSAVSGGTYVEVSWDSSIGAECYKIYRARTESGSYDYVDSSFTTTFEDIPEISGVYYYRVRAFDFHGHVSPFSNSAYVNYENRPLPPENIMATDSLYKVLLTWESNEAEAKYLVYRSIYTNSNFALMDSSEILQAFDWPPQAGHYFYRMKTVVNHDTSDMSDFVHVLFSGMLAPPGNLEGYDAGTHIHLTWTEPGGASYYEVYRSEALEGDYALLETVYINSADNAPDTAGTYYFKVKAFTRGDLASPFSSPVSVEFTP